MSLFLGIDTSNYTTSTALYDSKTGEMVQQKKLLPVKEGQLGLRQSDAVFHHTAQLHTLIEELLKDVDTSKIAAIAASSRPRPVDGSLSLSMSAEVQPRQYLPKDSARAFPLNLRHTHSTLMQDRQLTAQGLCSV